jgi:hypothetical protein
MIPKLDDRFFIILKRYIISLLSCYNDFELLKAFILYRPYGTNINMGLQSVTTDILSLTGQSHRDQILVE